MENSPNQPVQLLAGRPAFRVKLFCWWLSLVLGTSLPAASIPCGEEASEASSDFHRAVALYEEGWRGADDSLLEALEIWERLLDSGEEAPLAQAYYGSSCIARTRTVPDRQKARWLRRGARELERAVRSEPENLQIRLLRAVSFAILPRMAGKMDTVREDFEWLTARAEEDAVDPNGEGAQRPALAPECRQVIFYRAGAFALRNREPRAVRLLERAVNIEPADGMDRNRIMQMLRLAREQLPGESGETYDR